MAIADARDADPDEARFASLGANLVVRGQGVWHSKPAAWAPAHSDSDTVVRSIGRSSADSFLVSKGAAQPSTILPGQSSAPFAGHSARQFSQAEDDERSLIEQIGEQWDAELAAALSKAEASFKAEEAERFAAADAQWQQKSRDALAKAEAADVRNNRLELELHRLSEELTAAQATLTNREMSLARAEIAVAQANDRWQQEAHAAVSRAEAQWQEKFATALVKVEVAETRNSRLELELHRLSGELTAAQSALAERETALAQAEIAVAQAHDRARQDVQEAVSKAEASWKADEISRFAAAEAQWQEKHRDLSVKAEAADARNTRLELELTRLKAELTTVQAALVDRETAAAREWVAIERARETRQQEIQDALARAEMSWKAAEAARFAAAEAQWRGASTQAAMEAQAEIQASHDQSIELELNRLREEATSMRAALADREMALARECVAIERTRESSQRDIQEALLQAKAAWKAEEAARLAAAEEQWQRKSAQALAEIKARYDRTDSNENIRASAPAAPSRFRPSEIVLKPDRIGAVRAALKERDEHPVKSHALRNLVVAILLGASGMIAYPRVASMLSENAASSGTSSALAAAAAPKDGHR
ncbi:MAG TPA: hypothetical protein VHT51_18750 [Micropepsaceae bacterium]|jgi:hypothetical protein|nr:hypothetical protein [Micropepsaceae bacterium]